MTIELKPVPTQNGSAASKSYTKEIIRHPDFSRHDEPLYLNQQVLNIIWIGKSHLFAIYACYLMFRPDLYPRSCFAFDLFYWHLAGLGITVGCHRYWSHKTFKANTAVRILLMIFQTIAQQYPIYKWALEHRIHHKYSDTDADPHNSKRGFWFSHMGWLFLPKHKDFEEKLRTFDVPDLDRDPIVRFQSRWYHSLSLFFCFILPICFVYWYYELPLLTCLAMTYRRYVMTLHFTWSVNSFAYTWGVKPYDKNIRPTDNPLVSIVAVGEGWHNYHHTFPWDYKAAEFRWQGCLSTLFIEFFASIGWIWDMKTVSQKMLKDRTRRTGDLLKVESISDRNSNDFEYKVPADINELMDRTDSQLYWGWNDKLPMEFRKFTKILRPKTVNDVIS